MRARAGWVAAWAALWLLAPATSGCSGSGGDGPSDADVDAAEAADPTGCTMGSRRPPERPSEDTDGASAPELVFALKGVVLSDPGAALNVDRVCTSNGGPWTCLPPPELEKYLAGESFTVPADGPQGEENHFVRELYPRLHPDTFAAEGGLELMLQAATGRGTGSMLLMVRDYNGEPNDPQVTAVLSSSVFALAGPASGTEPPDVCIVEDPERGSVPHAPHMDDADGECFGEAIDPLPVEIEYDPVSERPIGITGYDPAWNDGSLWVWARSDAFQSGSVSAPVVVDEEAYVRDGQLVVHLPDRAALLLGVDPFVEVKLTDAAVIVDLGASATAGAHDVLLAGRWPASAFLEMVQLAGMCPGIHVLPPYSWLNQHFDVRANLLQEGPDVPCDGISTGIRFTAHPANLGGITPGAPVVSPCDG
jgi:hypothetical protein